MTTHQSTAREPLHARLASHPTTTLQNNPTDNAGGVRFVQGGTCGAAREQRSNNPKATL